MGNDQLGPASRKNVLAQKSDELLGALDHLKRAEQEKRSATISTERFHELADVVNATSDDVWRLAHEEESIGDRIPTDTESIDEVEDEERAG
jgi:hypothetical protein